MTWSLLLRDFGHPNPRTESMALYYVLLSFLYVKAYAVERDLVVRNNILECNYG
jgi:hypothetical protein